MQKVYISVLLSLIVAFLPTSCGMDDENGTGLSGIEQLDSIALILDSDPQEAHNRLNLVNVSKLDDSQYHYYVLLLTRALDHKAVDISSFEEKVLNAKDYFVKHKEAAKAALACFELARVYAAQGNSTKVLYFFRQADIRAEQADYSIPGLAYARVQIPYNLAATLFDLERYNEATEHLATALDNNNCPPLRRQHMLELKGLCHDRLFHIDSAAHCYDLAKELAEQNADSDGKRRIAYNSYMLLVKTKDYAKAEKRCNELLPLYIEENDSLYTGLTYMVLAEIHHQRGNAAQAVSNMLESESYLLNTPHSYIKLEVFNMLAKVYRQSGNTENADQYQQLYTTLKQEIEQKQADQVNELQVELSKQQGENANQLLEVKADSRLTAQSKNETITLLAIAIAIITLGAFAVSYKRSREASKKFRLVSEEELKIDLSRRELFNEMLLHIFDNPNVDRMYKVELMEKVEDACKHIPTALRYSYKKLYSKLKKEFPDFTHDEHTVCWYILTATIPEEEIPAALGLDSDTYRSVRQTMLEKMEKAGKPFPDYYERHKVKKKESDYS